MTAETLSKTRAAREALTHLRNARQSLVDASICSNSYSEELEQIDAMMRRVRTTLV